MELAGFVRVCFCLMLMFGIVYVMSVISKWGDDD